MDYRPIAYSIGVLLSILSISMILPMLMDLYVANEDWKVFLLCIVITAFFGGSLILSNLQLEFELNLKQTFLLTCLGWITICIFSALPFMLCKLEMSFADALFEATSGITTTGATVIYNLYETPPGIILWRSILQWLGGIGIIVMALSVLPFLKVGGMQLFRTESSQNEKTLPRAAQLSAAITVIYIALSLICMIAYMVAGFSPFHAVVHAMTTISTGGYSSFDASFRSFDNPGPEIVAIIFMFMGGIPFVLYLKTLYGDWKSLFKDPQVKAYSTIIALATVFVTMSALQFTDMNSGEAFRKALFSVISVMTGTGYANANYSLWGGFATSVFLFLMVIGGCAGSTTCGIKIFRFQVLYSVTKTQVLKLLNPNAMIIPRYNKKALSEDVILSVMSFFFVFASIFVIAVTALSLTGLDFITALSSVAACLANVGPGLGSIVGPAGTFFPLSDFAKYVLCFCMFIGRLELFTVLVLLSPFFWKD